MLVAIADAVVVIAVSVFVDEKFYYGNRNPWNDSQRFMPFFSSLPCIII